MRADLQTIVREASNGAHLYCCGPHRMIKAFQEATQGVPSERVHLEYFSAPEVAATSGDFSVVLARSGTRVDVPPGKTILEALLDAGIDVQYGCTQGVCGICEVSVLDGVPEHRDAILTDEAKKSNKSMILCCSGSKTPELILDL
jgi:vanillate O-demethylase ferredoxin subunit